MKQLSYIILLVASTLYSYSQSISRHVIASEGDWYSNSSGSLSWTLGEISVETYSNVPNILTQGFQQPDSLMYTGINEFDKEFVFSVSPNPTRDFVFVKTNSTKEFNVKVSDVSGKLIYRIQNCFEFEKIDLSEFSSGVYLLSISNNKISTKIKCIKIN